MIKALVADTRVRKVLIFSLVFVIAGVTLGIQMTQPPETSVLEDLNDMAVARTAMTHDGQAAEVEPLGEAAVMTLEDLLRPMSSEQDYVVFGGASIDDAITPSVNQDSRPALRWDTPDAVLAMIPQPIIPLATAAEEEEEEENPEGFVYLPSLPLSKELQLHTWEQCDKQGIDYALVLALMWRESRFQEHAVNVNNNGTRDNGIMQINDVNKTWLRRELSIDNLMDPYQNINAGTEMLGRFASKYGEHGALMAYQYGEGGMQSQIKQGVTTNSQIEQLYSKRAEYQAMLDKAR